MISELPSKVFEGKAAIIKSGEIPVVQTMETLKSLPKDELPERIRTTFGSRVILSYREANLPPCTETYKHAVHISEIVKEELQETPPLPYVIADIGTGSGLIAITLAHRLKADLEKVKIIGTAISGKALEVASVNIGINRAPVILRRRDVLDSLVAEFGKLDLIVSNPPFFKSNAIKPIFKEIDYVPMLAIDGGNDGLDFYRQLFTQAENALSDRGLLIVQHQCCQLFQILDIADQELPGRSKLSMDGARNCNTALVVGPPKTIQRLAKKEHGKIFP